MLSVFLTGGFHCACYSEHALAELASVCTNKHIKQNFCSIKDSVNEGLNNEVKKKSESLLRGRPYF